MKILMLLKSSLDYDSRVKKEIGSLTAAGYKVSMVSVNSQVDHSLKSHVVLKYQSKRRFLPGVSSLLSHFTFIRAAMAACDNHDIVHCHDLNTLLAGVLLKIARGKKVKLVYDSHEYAPNDVPNEGKVSIAIKFLFEKILTRYVDCIIVVSDGIAEKYRKLYKPRILSTVMNCPARVKIERTEYFHNFFGLQSDVKIFLYQGALSRGRGIDIILDSFEKLKIKGAVLVVMGSGVLADMVEEAAQRCDRVYYHPPVPSKNLLGYTASADYGISFIEDSCLSYRYCLPNKIFEYLMAGLPVLTSNLPEMKRLVEAEHIGIVAEQNSASAFQLAVEKMMAVDKQQFKKAIDAAQFNYCWQNQESILLDSYRKLYHA
ncbi:glycosyltransferase [Halomonas sp. A40-4]|uniref:glycosyltransferase n=1 Tax=Halomonas sp. A40-4 TaxID=2785909 RepID=UPI0018EFEEE2|nr:glycosyltransferase [Halomonas sp. A40-4]QPL47217.1 glycosyltransferase [Halomonas sp. A40-4]